MTGGEIVLTVVDDGAVEQIFQEQRRCAAAAVRDYQVGFQVGTGAQGIEDTLTLIQIHPEDLGPGHPFLRAVLGRQGKLVEVELLEHLGRGRRTARKALNQEAALPAMAPFQLEAKPAELGREGVVEEEHVHGRYHLPWAAASVANRSASIGMQTSCA